VRRDALASLRGERFHYFRCFRRMRSKTAFHGSKIETAVLRSSIYHAAPVEKASDPPRPGSQMQQFLGIGWSAFRQFVDVFRYLAQNFPICQKFTIVF
jgi:hypothetical protein